MVSLRFGGFGKFRLKFFNGGLKPHKLGLLHVAIGNANLVKTLFGVKRARIFKHTRIMRGRAHRGIRLGNKPAQRTVVALFHKAFQKQFKIGVVPLVTLLEKVVKRARFQIGRHGVVRGNYVKARIHAKHVKISAYKPCAQRVDGGNICRRNFGKLGFKMRFFFAGNGYFFN